MPRLLERLRERRESPLVVLLKPLLLPTPWLWMMERSSTQRLVREVLVVPSALWVSISPPNQ
jgi:hypothetical protein